MGARGIQPRGIESGPFDRDQIFSIEDLLKGAKPNIPKYLPAYVQAKKPNAENPAQTCLFDTPTP